MSIQTMEVGLFHSEVWVGDVKLHRNPAILSASGLVAYKCALTSSDFVIWKAVFVPLLPSLDPVHNRTRRKPTVLG